MQVAPAVGQNSYHQAFEQRPELPVSETPAIIEPLGVEGGRVRHRVVSYRELIEGVDRLASALSTLGVSPGDRVLLMVPMSSKLYQSILAVLKLGGVCLFIDPADGIGNLDRSAASMSPKAFIGVPRAHSLRLLSRAVRRIPVQISTTPLPFGLALPWEEALSRGRPGFETAAVRGDDPAMISFTSGSSGTPKGVCRSHSDLRSIFAMLCRHEAKHSLGVNLCAFPVLPLDDLSWGRTSLIPFHPPGKLGQATAAEMADQMRQFPPALISAPPTLVRKLVEHSRATGQKFPSVRYVFTGGGMVPIRLVREVAAAMPQAEFHILYGSTEAEPVSMISAAEVLAETAAKSEEGAGMCVGRIAPDSRVEIVAPHDGPLERLEPVGGIGEILVAGPHVNRSYYRDPEMTRRHKLEENGTVWHRMGDLAYRDGQGRLWLVGRQSNRVVTEGITLHTGQVEPVLDTVPGVHKTALIGIDGHAIAIVECEEGADVEKVLRKVRDKARERAIPLRLVLPCQEIPYDARIGAKTQYGELVRRYEAQVRKRTNR